MDLIKSWKESLQLLQQQNIKSFFLIAVKNVVDIYNVMNTPLTSRGNWIAIVILVMLIGLTNIIKMFHLFWFATILLDSVRYFLCFIFLLGMRPSVHIKNWEYFRYYVERYWYLLASTVILGIFHVDVIPFTFIIYMIFLLFVFDSYGSPKDIKCALRNSCIMFIYNFPIFLGLFGILSLLNIIIYALIAFALGYFGGLAIAVLLYVLFVPIQLVLIVNLYIKYLHGQPILYFKQPE